MPALSGPHAGPHLSHLEEVVMRLTTVLLLVALAGCASMANSVFPLRSTVEVKDSDFEPSATLLGVQERNGKIADYHFLRSWVDKSTGVTRHQLYVTYRYGDDWRFYERANGEARRSLEFVSISRDVSSCSQYGCSYAEHFGVDLDEDLLRERRDRGYAVKFYARSGHELIVTVSPAQIAAQLEAADNLRRARGLSGATEAK
jgi:hypothetical protein